MCKTDYVQKYSNIKNFGPFKYINFGGNTSRGFFVIHGKSLKEGSKCPPPLKQGDGAKNIFCAFMSFMFFMSFIINSFKKCSFSELFGTAYFSLKCSRTLSL